MGVLKLGYQKYHGSDYYLGLTKEVRYPVQIIQGTEALRFILEKGYDASNVSRAAKLSLVRE